MSIIEPVKFLYAANLRLDKPLRLEEGGSVFAPRARDIAYEATRRLIDCALSREVNFVLLRGELYDAHCGAKALLFLAGQATRLSNAGIACCILNEGTPLGAEWRGEFPGNVQWLDRAAEDEHIVCGACELPLASLLAPAPPSLQGIGPEESGPGGAWLVSLPGSQNPSKNEEPEREFIELDALRWEHCEMDVTMLEREDDLTVSWRAVKDGFREHRPVRRPILLHLKLTGVMKKRSIFYGEDFMRNPGTLMKKLNSDEFTLENFVLVNSLSDETISAASASPSMEAYANKANAKGANALEDNVWREVAAFKAETDLRAGLFDALKERGVLIHILSTDAASLLENMTETDAKSLLKESCDMANYWLFKDSVASK